MPTCLGLTLGFAFKGLRGFDGGVGILGNFTAATFLAGAFTLGITGAVAGRDLASCALDTAGGLDDELSLDLLFCCLMADQTASLTIFQSSS
ncbi:hypothetical protein B9Z35_05525 [Limnohabitans sp. Jir61]|nr:hypothetical protein B9Z35_05525 [Limnohabitans sp. Jir61]